MGLKRIIAELECDKCGAAFTSKIAPDSTGTPTVFEAVCEAVESCQVPGKPQYEEGGYHDGEFYGPCCWEEKSEELFIQEIRDGKISEEFLEGLDEKYKSYLPRERLTHA